MNKTSIINPVISVPFRDRALDVSELKWRDYMRALKDLVGSIMEMIGPDGKSLVIEQEKLIHAIAAQEGLVAFLIERSTNLTQDDIQDLTGTEVIRILTAIIDLNLNEEVIGSGKKLAGRMGGAFQVSSTTQSPKR